MKLKVDTAGVLFLLVRDAVPVLDWATKEVKADDDGVPLYQVQLVAMGDGEAEVINVKVVGQPEGLTVNGPVRIEGLTVQPWSMGDKHGLAFRAAAIHDGGRILARNGQASG